MTNPAIGLSTSQQCALSEMGIDVWVRRTAPRREVSASVDAAAMPEPPTQATSRPMQRAALPVQADRLETRARTTGQAPPAARSSEDYRAELDCLATAGIVIVGRWQNALDKRLANDIAGALGHAIADDSAKGQPAKVQQTAFQWPVTQTGDPSFAAACGAFNAFVRGQAERAHARCVVLFGEVAAALARDADAAVSIPLLRLPPIGALRADPNWKKALWLNVSQNVLG